MGVRGIRLVGRLAVLAGALALAPGATAATFDVGQGREPEVVADPDGTTWVAWHQENRGPSAQDVTHVCRVPVGAAACDRKAEFVEGTDVSLGVSILRNPGDGSLLLVTLRSFSGSVQNGTFVRRSTDGGATWGPATRIATGQEYGIDDAVFFRGNSIATSIDTPNMQAQVAGLPPSPLTTTRATSLVPSDTVESALGTVDGTTLLFVHRQAGRDGELRWRAFTGNADPNVTANWGPVGTAAGIVADADLGTNGLAPPVVAGFENGFSGDLVVRRYDKATNAFGPAAKVRTESGAVAPHVDLDTSSNVHLFFLTGEVAGAGRNLAYVASPDGVTWPGTPVVLEANAQMRELESAAGTAGVGAAAWEGPNGDTGAWQRIRVANIGGPGTMPPDPPPPGTGGGPVQPPAPTCTKVPQLGVAQLVALTGCFTGAEPKLSITTPFLVNGVKVDPQGQAVTIDTKARTLKMGSKARVSMDPIKLATGERTWTFPASGTYAAGTFDLDKAGFGADLLGLEVLGDADLRFTKGEARLEAHITLPDPFSSVRPDITLRSNNQVGLRFDGLKIDDPIELPFGFTLKSFEYVADPPTWKGAVEWTPPVPTGGGDTYGGSIAVVNGKLEQLRVFGRFPGLGKGIVPPYAYLNFAGVELRTKPELQLTGEFVLSGGPGGAITVGRLGDTIPEDRYGLIKLSLGSPFRLGIEGEVFVYGFKLGEGYLRYTYPLDLAFGASAEVGDCDLETGGAGDVGASAKFDGFLAASKGFAFSLEAAAKVCYGIATAKGNAVLSSKGVAGCATFGIEEPTGIANVEIGAGHLWEDPITDIDLMLSSCSVEPYRVASAAQAGGPGAFTVGKGLRQLNVRLVGTPGASPRAVLVAPDGTRHEPGTGAARFPTHLAHTDVADGVLSFVLATPPAGTWKVEPLPGSPAVAKVELSRDAPDAVVRGTVRRAGDRRELRWTRRNAVAGERVTFTAEGGGTAQPLGTAKGRAGTVRFTPKYGPGGTRSVWATVERGGIGVDRQKLATFTVPPPPRATRATRARVVRRGTRVTVSWRPGRALVAQEVLVRLTDGTGELRKLRRGVRTLRLSGVRRGVTGTVTIRGVARDGRRTAPATAKVRPLPRRR